MATGLLTTRLQIPPAPRRLLERAALRASLEQEVPAHRLTLVSAPAGYGKTTMLAQWARASQYPVAWLTAGEEDSDPARFLRYLVTACENALPEIRDSPASVLANALLEDVFTVLPEIVNAAAAMPDQSVLLVDDAHLIADRGIFEALAFLIDHAPPNLHLVLASREAPSLPLARYRARGDLFEIDAGTLRFSRDETRDFLNGPHDLSLEREVVDALHAQTEGWAAGLQLAALSIRTGRGPGQPATITGRNRFIADYIREDVLAWLRDDDIAFLLQTSVLDRLTGPLCNALTERTDSDAMLARLESENLFLTPLDDNRDWYRYHRLFADVLREELRRRLPAEVSGLHRRAARWFLDNAMPEQAFDHALAGDDRGLAAAIVERYLNELLTTGQLKIVQRWLDAVPPGWRESHPVFVFADAGLLLMSGGTEEGLRHLDEAETRLIASGGKDAAPTLARITAVRCFMACRQNDVERALGYADKALKDLPEDDMTFRADIFGALGDTYRRNARWDDARAAYQRVLDIYRDRPSPVKAVQVYGALADLDLMRGLLRSAFEYWTQALDMTRCPESQGLVPLTVTGWVYLRLGEIHFEWNDLPLAREYLRLGMERADLGGIMQARIAGAVLLARLHLTDGEIAAAEAALESARYLAVGPCAGSDWADRFERCRVEVWLAQEEIPSAVAWADGVLAEGHEVSPVVRLAVIRVLLARDDPTSTDSVGRILDHVLADAEQQGRLAIQIEALALRALLWQRHGHDAEALIRLERALRLAEPEGYIRLFADLGQPMARLIQETRSRGVMTEYVSRLLAAAGSDARARRASLTEPLSPRELDVLRLVAAGLTNKEVADLLFISTETVKKHTSSIYGKLGVGNRTEAATRARQLALLDDR